MNYIKDMNNALDYIEKNINKDISQEEVARVAHISKFHFLRIFNILTGMTLGQYIRGRRLTLAAKEVMSTNMKIIDISYKYGYETPEAFTKAFKALHDVSPTEARKKGEILKAITPISFQITVKGEKRMDYKIVSKDSFKVVGLSRKFSTRYGENLREIPKFWDEVNSSEIDNILMNNQGDLGILGICTGVCENKDEMKYMIAVQGDEVEALKSYKDYEVFEMPKSTFAVFEVIGPMPHAIQKAWHQIFAEWFPATQYEHANAPEFEAYLPGDPYVEDYKCEIWIPIVEK
ncbi:effector binding domain-containing protein [Clostridium sp.]|uniref:AraC family transcriptional regulator n=1 Tax=Clostridium sp. TaxID=1506 RepID=UPI003464DF44